MGHLEPCDGNAHLCRCHNSGKNYLVLNTLFHLKIWKLNGKLELVTLQLEGGRDFILIG